MGSRRMMNPAVTLALVLWNLPKTITQATSILPTTTSSTYPACAFSCPNLNAAASYCTQTNAGASQEVVNSCFCQRSEVTPLYLGSSGVCDAFCTVDTDRTTLQKWFQGYCSAAGFSSGADGTVTTLITSTRTPSATATGQSQNGSGGGSSSSSESTNWFASHWRWVVMLIVLVAGLGALAILAVCFKRRHARKVDERRRAASGFPTAQDGSSPDIGHGRDMWGPHQHMAHTRGWEYTPEQDREMKEVSTAAGGRMHGGGLGKTNTVKEDGKTRLGKRSQPGSQRSARHVELDPDEVRGGEDENTMAAIASVRRSRSERKREREREREREKEIERGLRGIPIKSDDGTSGRLTPVMSEKEKEIT